MLRILAGSAFFRQSYIAHDPIDLASIAKENLHSLVFDFIRPICWLFEEILELIEARLSPFHWRSFLFVIRRAESVDNLTPRGAHSNLIVVAFYAK